MAQDEPLASAAVAEVLARIDTHLARIEAALADRDMPAGRLVIALRDHFGAAPLAITRPRPEARSSTKASLQSVGFKSSVRLERQVKAVHVDEAAVRYGRSADVRCDINECSVRAESGLWAAPIS